MIENGVARAFGPTDLVLKEVVKNHRDLRPVAVTGVPNLGAAN